MMMVNPALLSIPSPLLHFNLDSLYRIRFNFHGVKLSWIMSFCDFHVFIFADDGFCDVRFASSQPLPLMRKKLL